MRTFNMAKKQPTYVVLEHEYCGDGVSADYIAFTGTKLQCERFLYSEDHHNPMRLELESEYYADEDE